MSRSFRAVITAFSLGLVLSVFGVAQASAQGILNEILTRMDTHYKALSSVKSNIKMEKVNTQLGETDVSEGTVKFLPKTDRRALYARIDWSKPFEESMAVISDGYKLYLHASRQVI